MAFDYKLLFLIIEQQKLMERQSKCQLCIDNSNFDKHLLIALGVKV